MTRRKPLPALNVDTRWQLQRPGGIALAPGGRQAVCSVSSHDMDKNSTATTLWLLDTACDAPRALTRCGDQDGRPAWSPRGDSIAFVHDPAAVPVCGNRLVLAEIDLASRRVTTLVDDAAWDVGAPCYSPDGRALAFVAANVGAHHTAPRQLALRSADGSWRALGAGWDHEVGSAPRWSADGGALLFTAEVRGRCHLWRCGIAAAACTVVHSGGWVQDFDLAGDTLLLAVDSALHPVRLLARHRDAAAQRIEHFNDKLLAGAQLGEVREVALTGALGDAVQMWLTFPAGFDAKKKKQPVLHVIHGGPAVAVGDSFGYRWNPHVLAGAGHVVAQVNYHGSSGFGWAFKHSLIGRQGQLELQDIEAGTDWLLQQGWADKKRVYASGGSYGGFLVAWMNGHVAPGRYRACVCHAGVFDRIATFSADSYPVRPKDLQATYWEDMPKVLAQSPHAFAATMQTPTLVIHGAKDDRVPDTNGLAYYNTLKARGVDARLLWFPDENHWVLKPRNSKLWYGEFLAWLARHA